MIISGFEIMQFAEVGSTNDTAAEYADVAGKRLVITAKRQTAGRGRRGRKWQSLDGNLFFSLLLEFPLKELGKLIMAATLGLAETVRFFAPEAKVQIKWPNDVLINNAKVSGMLLEKGAGEYMIIGIGVNTAQSPNSAEMLYPTTSLREAGITVTAADFLQQFLPTFAANIAREAADLRQEWLQNAKGIGEKITVKQNGGEQNGIFEGIDDNADLILRIGDKKQKILAGDVFYTEVKNG